MDVTYKLEIKHIFISAFVVALDQMRIDASDLLFVIPLYFVFGYNVMLEKSFSCILCFIWFAFILLYFRKLLKFSFFIDQTHDVIYIRVMFVICFRLCFLLFIIWKLILFLYNRCLITATFIR